MSGSAAWSLSTNATMAYKKKFAGVLSKASSNYKSHVWKHFGHLTTETSQGVREVGKDKTVCRICRVIMKYKAGNTTNKLNFMFPELVFLDKKCVGDVGLMITKLYFVVWTLPEWYVLFSS